VLSDGWVGFGLFFNGLRTFAKLKLSTEFRQESESDGKQVLRPQLSTQSSISSCGDSASNRGPHRQRLLLFRYSRMSQRGHPHLESLIQRSASSSSQSGVVRRGASLDTPPVPPERTKRFRLRKENQYQSMIEDNSVDSDGSNMTSVTTTTTGAD
jgi:hypothetical protein